jgi:hypothetical protein
VHTWSSVQCMYSSRRWTLLHFVGS